MDYQAEFERSVAQWQEFKLTLADQDLLDDDGYPTEISLNAIRDWHWSDADGWFEFIKSVWWMPTWGWDDKTESDEFDSDKIVRRIYMSTGGWSGNESCIRAMQDNHMMWHLNWLQSRRGGHYTFQLRDLDQYSK